MTTLEGLQKEFLARLQSAALHARSHPDELTRLRSAVRAETWRLALAEVAQLVAEEERREGAKRS